jgi:hypothetical protein
MWTSVRAAAAVDVELVRVGVALGQLDRGACVGGRSALAVWGREPVGEYLLEGLYYGWVELRTRAAF